MDETNERVITPDELRDISNQYKDCIFEFNSMAKKAAQKGYAYFQCVYYDIASCPFYVIMDLLPSMGYDVTIDREVSPIETNNSGKEVTALNKITVSW